MKKILTTLAVSGFTAAAFAQGTVNWSGVANLFFAQTNSGVISSFAGGGTVAGGTQGVTAGNASIQYYYELLVSSTASTAPTTVANLSSWSDTGLEAENGTVANGRITQLASSTQAVAANWASGVTESVILVGWSGNLGSSWATVENELANWSADAVANAYFGVSAIGSLAAQSGNPGVTVFGVGAGQINNGAAAGDAQLNALPVPEPGTMALAALGGASLLMFRRKK